MCRFGLKSGPASGNGPGRDAIACRLCILVEHLDGLERVTIEVFGHDHNPVSDLLGITPVTGHDAENLQAALLRLLEPCNDVSTNVFFRVFPTHREHENRVIRSGVAGPEPRGKYSVPAFIVGPGSEFRNVVHGCVSLDLAEFAEIIHGMAAIRGTSTDTEKKQTPTALREGHEFIGQGLDSREVYTLG